MNSELIHFAARLRELIRLTPTDGVADDRFNSLALELFALQYQGNSAYQKICAARGLTPASVKHWSQIPAVPTAAFKELELTSLAPTERTSVFHSSGTTEQKPSRHFHGVESMALYETSLWQWFEQNVFAGLGFKLESSHLLALTPLPAQVPHSSLVHMFESVSNQVAGRKLPASEAGFFGSVAPDGSWVLDFAAMLNRLQSAVKHARPQILLGTAFSFVHLLDYLAENNLSFQLPAGSRVMETGGYKNRSRTMPKAELHALITARLGVTRADILCEYGMSELSSQAYDTSAGGAGEDRFFHFPWWARVQVISPETGQEVADGETGLIRILDLANTFSVAAIQTEDLGVRRGTGFELVGRAQLAEARGCSLMTA